MELKISTPFFFLKRILRGEEIILVDFFDTIAYRFVHPSKIFNQWAKVFLYKYPDIAGSIDDLAKIRRKAIEALSVKYEEPPYRETMIYIYKDLNVNEGILSEEDFCEESLKIDVAVELGCQYPNRKLIKLLRELKSYGKKLYLISDFYLPQETYPVFLSNIGCKDLFEDIYISEKYNMTKRHGSLYKFVMSELNLHKRRVVMIGDNKQSDYLMANENGIRGCLYFSYFHKLIRILGKFSEFNYQKKLTRELYNHSIFREYAIVLYYVINKMYADAKVRCDKNLAFISRGGYFLQKLFDSYQDILVRDSEKISTEYMLNSRKVCIMAYQDYLNGGGANEDLLMKYIKPFIHDNRISLVDEGWYHRTQTHIAEIMDCNTDGFYIGSRQKPDIKGHHKHYIKGLLFDMGKDGIVSKYYYIFCTNCSMYEQILTAPHGSVDSYQEDDCHRVIALFKENEMETYLYEYYIKPMQDDMFHRFQGLCAWMVNQSISEKLLARMILKSVLFANRKRCEFLNQLDSNRYDNCTAGKLKDKGIKDVRINPKEFILHPIKYLGMVCKVQRKIVKKPILEQAYYPFALLYYLYIRITERI